MGRQVVRAQVSLHFDDFPDAFDAVLDANEQFAEQFPGDEGGIPVIKGARQRLHSGIIPIGRPWETRGCPSGQRKKNACHWPETCDNKRVC